MQDSKDRKPLVSIITVNFNQYEVTCALLKSLQRISYRPVEILVVDNGSKVNPMKELGPGYPNVKVIHSEVNLGFAGGNNLAVRQANGEYLLFINNDTEVPEGFLEPLVNRMEQDLSIGMISPKIKFYYSPDTIQFAGYTPMHGLTLRQNLIGYREIDKGQYDKGGFTHSIHGAAMMVRRSVVFEVGMMAELYFLYYEEHDWAARVKAAGFNLYYEPASYILHKESVSTGKDSPLKTYYITRNRFLYARRNLYGLKKFSALVYLSFVAFPKAVTMYLLKGKMDLMSSVVKAYFWNFLKFNKINVNQHLEKHE